MKSNSHYCKYILGVSLLNSVYIYIYTCIYIKLLLNSESTLPSSSILKDLQPNQSPGTTASLRGLCTFRGTRKFPPVTAGFWGTYSSDEYQKLELEPKLLISVSKIPSWGAEGATADETETEWSLKTYQSCFWEIPSNFSQDKFSQVKDSNVFWGFDVLEVAHDSWDIMGPQETQGAQFAPTGWNTDMFLVACIQISFTCRIGISDTTFTSLYQSFFGSDVDDVDLLQKIRIFSSSEVFLWFAPPSSYSTSWLRLATTELPLDHLDPRS